MNRNRTHRHHVYVVELSDRVWNEPSFRKANPDYRGNKPLVYVGMTGFDPDLRFDRHKAGIQANRFVQADGLRLLPQLYEVTKSPGGIINFISKTGDEPGGAIGLQLGVNGGRQTRLDLDYAGQLGPKTRFHIGGFSRQGEGDRDTGFNASNGGQIKANLTQQFDRGFVRLHLKALDDKTPTFLPVRRWSAAFAC